MDHECRHPVSGSNSQLKPRVGLLSRLVRLLIELAWVHLEQAHRKHGLFRRAGNSRTVPSLSTVPSYNGHGMISLMFMRALGKPHLTCVCISDMVSLEFPQHPVAMLSRLPQPPLSISVATLGAELNDARCGQSLPLMYVVTYTVFDTQGCDRLEKHGQR